MLAVQLPVLLAVPGALGRARRPDWGLLPVQQASGYSVTLGLALPSGEGVRDKQQASKSLGVAFFVHL